MSAEQPAQPYASYELDISVEFLGPLPEDYNRAAPEATPAQRAAADAVMRELRAAGFTVTGCEHGSLRTGTVDVDPLEIAVRLPAGARPEPMPDREMLRTLMGKARCAECHGSGALGGVLAMACGRCHGHGATNEDRLAMIAAAIGLAP